MGLDDDTMAQKGLNTQNNEELINRELVSTIMAQYGAVPRTRQWQRQDSNQNTKYMTILGKMKEH